MTTDNLVVVRGLRKNFTLHNQGGVVLPVLAGVSLEAARGECVVLNGPSGAGKSTLLRCLYANYRVQDGEVRVRHDGNWVDMGRASPRDVMAVRRRTIGYVSQFLRVIPRVPALDIVMEPLVTAGVAPEIARVRAQAMLERLNISPRLWKLPPATFSGGEQQRINVAHGLVCARPVLLLDEPTAALDAVNRCAVVDLINEAKNQGTAMIGIFHDREVREAVATRFVQFNGSRADGQ